ncbi:MAG: helix-turn-helix domain-containing protein [Nocardioidaceae bacterium]
MDVAELLLHPVRLRVVQTLLGGRVLTTGQLREELPDLAPATLYRHLGTLLRGDVLEVVEQRRVRGAVERTYRLREHAPSVSAEDAATMSAEEHRRAFGTFVAGLLADFDRYLDRAGDGTGHGAEDGVDLGRDLVGYRQAALHLSDDEMRHLLADLVAVIRPRLAVPPAPGRRRRLLTTVVMPAPETAPDPGAEEPRSG